MIHVLNYNGQIIDFVSRDDTSVIRAVYNRNTNTDTLDITILSERAEHFKKRNRVLIQDQNEVYREYIIERAEEDDGYLEVECTASYLLDIATAKPIPTGKYEKMTINQKLSETLRDSGWVVGDCDYAGIKTNSWTSVRTPLEMISQLETAHEVKADYEIVIDGYEVIERRVNMRKPYSLFKGKEIVYGKDLLSMKRVVDFSEVKTALYAFGPEAEDGSRIETIVVDNEAQEQFNLPYRYIWGIYEPETEGQDMTLKRLETLARTELDKRKSAAVSYEISVADLEKEYPHEIIRLGDIVRVKNLDFTPTLYAESEVVGVEHELISNDCTYEFGKIIEYQEDDLFKYFRSKLDYINQKLNEGFTNVNTIVKDTLDNELQYFEQKIIKGSTPPDNPVNDLLWLDTSNPDVAVLRRYWNGRWINSTAEKASDVGAITREQALYSELNNTFINLSIQHSKLLNEVYDVIESEYFVDNDLRREVQTKLDDTILVFDQIKYNLDTMNEDTATIGKLISTQELFLEYRQRMQTLYTTVEDAKIAIDNRFKLLQSQYTDEKFNDAMSKVAEGIGGTWNAETGQLLADIPSQKELEDALKTYINGQDEALKQLIDGEVNSKITQTKNELSSNISAVSAKVDGIQVGGRNLLPTVYDYYNVSGLYGYIKISDDNTQKVIKITDNDKTVDMSGVFFGFTKNGYDANAGVRWEHSAGSLIRNFDNDPSLKLYNYFSFFPKDKSTLDKIFKRYKIKLEKGTVATDYTQAPEDIQANITKAQADATTASKAYADAQDALRKTEANAYADGKVTAEEQRAIKDAQAKFDAAKTYADAQDLLVKTQTKAYADGLITAEEERAIKDAQDNLAAAKAYADAQDALRKTEVQAYADGIVTEEEERAIADAQAKLTQAKAYADTTKAAALAYTDEKLEPITSTQTKQSTDIKQLQDGITLKADKTELTTMYDTNIKPLETQVNEQKSQLDILPAQINSKVSQSTYDADINDIVSRLSSADTQRQQLSNAINDRVTIKEYTDNKTATTNQINTAVNNIQVGGRNLLENSANINKAITDTLNNYDQYWQVNIGSAHRKLQLGDIITISFDVQMERGEVLKVYDTNSNFDYMFGQKTFTNISNKKQRLSFTLPLITASKTTTTWQLSFYNNNNGDRFTIENIKIEKGNKATDWTPAPEDTQAQITKSQQEAENAAKAYADAQDNLKQTEANAYADGLITAEEQRAIQDAQNKLAEAKKYSESKSSEAQSLAEQYALTKSNEALENANKYTDDKNAEVEKTLTIHDSRITQNGSEINARATKEEFNASRKTLSKVIADLTINTTTGLTLSYDENGVIQSSNIGPDGVKIDATKININDGDVVIQNGQTYIKDAYIDKLFAKSAFIDKLKSTDIDFNKATASGGVGSATLSITGDRILQNGKFNRIWKSVAYDYDVSTIMREGYIKFADFSRDREISMSAFGISTFVDGSGNQAGYEGSSGTISWWDKTYGNADGITMSSEVGVPALKSYQNRIVLEANSTVDIYSETNAVHLNPNVHRFDGVNRFAFTIGDSSTYGRVGYQMFGAGTDGVEFGSGLRFHKSRNQPRVSVVNMNYATSSSTVFEAGIGEFEDVNARYNTLILRPSNIGEVRIQQKGSSSYKDLRLNTLHTVNGNAFANHSGTDVFFGVGGGSLSITNNNGYNGGYPVYRDIHFQNWQAHSHERSKYDIENWNDNILDVFRNDLQLKKYKLNSEKDSEKQLIHRGIVIRENSAQDEFPAEWRSGDGFNGNEVVWWNTKAIQELIYKVDKLEKEMEELTNEPTS